MSLTAFYALKKIPLRAQHLLYIGKYSTATEVIFQGMIDAERSKLNGSTSMDKRPMERRIIM
jgi:hypothetical protein